MKSENTKYCDITTIFSNRMSIHHLILVAVLLVLASSVMIFTTMSDSEDSSADNGSCGTDLQWSVDGDTLTITGSGAMDNYDNNSNKAPWRNFNSTVTKLILPDGLSSIGDYGFFDMNKITTVDMSNTALTTIGEAGFRYCENLTSAPLPDGLTYIGAYAFSENFKLESISIPQGVEEVGELAFQLCKSLESVFLPDSVTTIGNSAFFQCYSLKSVFMPYGLKTIGVQAFKFCENLPTIILPDSVTTIGSGAFYNCTNLKSVVIPDSVTNIESSAFHNTGLTSVVIPGSLNELKFETFNECKNLTSVVMHDGVTTIGTFVFQGCKELTSIDLPNSLKTIGEVAFGDCVKLTSIDIPNGVTTLDNGAFSNTGLTSVVIPGSVETIDWRAFYSCKNLTSVVISEGVKEIRYGLFQNCINLASVTIPSTLLIKGNDVFDGCALTTLTLTGTDPNLIMSSSVWNNNKLPGMATAFETIIIDGNVDLNGLSDDTNLKLVFTVDTITDSSGLSATSNICADNGSLGGSVYTFNNSLSVMKWEKDTSSTKCTITFDTKGGSQIRDIVALNNSTVALPIPVKTGYEFDGWFDITNNPVTSPAIVSGDIALHAEYNVKTFEVSYDGNGAGNTAIPVTITYEDLRTDGLTLKPSDTFTPPTGKTFLGWTVGFSALRDAGEELSDKDIDGDVTIYAIWSFTVEVSFDANGGPVDPASRTVTYGKTYGENGALPTVTWAGHNFQGWFTSETGGTKVDDDTKVWTSVDHTLYAQWSSISTPTSHDVTHLVKVTFDANGGTVDSATKMVTYGEEYGYLPMPEYNKHLFEGWYHNEELITQSSKVSISNDHTLTAKWSPISYDSDIPDDDSRSYDLWIIVFAVAILILMILLIFAYRRRKNDES